MRVDPRITYALVLAVVMEAAGALLWTGRAAARLEEVEHRLAAQHDVSERLARVEEQLTDARSSLGRIERRLDAR